MNITPACRTASANTCGRFAGFLMLLSTGAFGPERQPDHHGGEPLNIWVFAAFGLIAHFFFNKSGVLCVRSSTTKNDASKVRHLLPNPHKTSLFPRFPQSNAARSAASSVLQQILIKN